MFEAAIEALSMVFTPSRLLFIVLGIFIGIVIGILPGLGGPVGMALVLPFTFGMDPATGIGLLIGMISVIHTADTFPSVLLGVPGTSGSQATILDGYELTKQGKAGNALGAAFFSSLVGGIIGAIVLFMAIPIGRPIITAFGSPELFMLSLLGISMVGVLAGNAPVRGIVAGLIGMMLGTIGGAPGAPQYRFTFDTVYLYDGIPLAVFALGLFALPEIIELVTKKTSISREGVSGSRLTGIKAAIKNKWLMFRSAVMGAAIGFIPGLGGSVVDWISYGVAKQTTKNNYFGEGDIRGVIAPESANNAKEGGSLIPTLLFSIPGSGTTAMLLGGLVLLGIQPGPSMLEDDLPITLSIVWTLVIANIIGAILCIVLAKYISKLSAVPAVKLFPFLVVIMVFGSYQSTGHWGDILAFLVIGLLGWVMKELDWPRAPIIVGFVLSNASERYLHLSMSGYGISWVTNPIVIILGIFILFILFSGFFVKKIKSSKLFSGGDEYDSK